MEPNKFIENIVVGSVFMLERALAQAAAWDLDYDALLAVTPQNPSARVAS